MAIQKRHRGEGSEKAGKKGELLPSRDFPLLGSFQDIDQLFEQMMPRDLMRPPQWAWPRWAERRMPLQGRLPRVDIVDRDTELVVYAALPGVTKQDLDLTITDNTVTIKGSTRLEGEKREGEYFQKEISCGAFTRTVNLPVEIDTTKAMAKFKEGILEITLPKAGKSKRRSVEIK